VVVRLGEMNASTWAELRAGLEELIDAFAPGSSPR
jgi:hypothetical protein